MLFPPAALLLDFGGVLVESPRPQPAAPPALVQRLHALTGQTVPIDTIVRDITDGSRRYSRWRDDTSREQGPVEVAHERVWEDFITPSWPDAAREAVRREALSLSYAWAWGDEWTVRDGIAEALRTAAAGGIPMVVVSNAISGAAHRDFLASAGLGPLFAAEVYSDEAGIRKPNPELAWRAADAIGVSIGKCWFVGDMVDRDIACARRAGAGAAILMRSSRTARAQPTSEAEPDVIIDDGFGLLDLLHQAGLA
ncbi:HAD-IA family hydrolase [Micromonospora sp. NPDC048898]|uniref:HAD-IA family hydrolase n=1 Tax=Micromonospora sp. NPDC048898 TaxID=3364260 RepID=UPI00371DF2CD